MIFKTCKILKFLNKSHSAISIKSTFEALSVARFTNAVRPQGCENTSTPENVPNTINPKDLERNITERYGKDAAQSLKSLFKPKKPFTVGVSFLWDETYAKQVVEKIMGDDQNNCVVLESHPGFGLTTVNFIEAGIPVHIFRGPFAGPKLYEKYPNKFEVYQHSLFRRHGLQHEFVTNIIEKASKSGKKSKIVGVNTHHIFLSSLPRQILHKNLWDLCDSTEFYIILSEQVYNRITNYRLSMTRVFTYCLFSCLFDVELLDKYPTSAFLPILQTDAMYLVRIKKKDEKSMMVNEQLLPEYVTFLKILGRQKSNLVIQTLEKWVPGCGLYLISKGIRLTTQAKDITESEAITLFKFFIECEGYENFKVMHKVLENEERERKGK